ncbi:hypothetical protein [Halogeometricum luteum]|uniref:Uncharacterized protein n=1 Tax=Halogeometricum luteum TaxID=2950537 RepID=A0ABU2G490_9EURY|nr:hypothetical protein [Halogeometricum sp. S3BR5-2]MDS0295029.1 hypothetical protein [Halogeometricum sp. S3BR5-2]
MSDDHSSTEYRTALDDRLASVLAAADEDRLRLAAGVVGESDDRWYGRLVARSCEAAGGEPASATDAVLRGATAVELLRGYCRLRSGLFVQLADEVAHSLNWDPAAAVLSGDFLQTAACSTVLSAETDRRDECVEPGFEYVRGIEQ